MVQNQSPLVEYNKNSSRLAHKNSMQRFPTDEDTLICSERINTSPRISEREDHHMKEELTVPNDQQNIHDAFFSTEWKHKKKLNVIRLPNDSPEKPEHRTYFSPDARVAGLT